MLVQFKKDEVVITSAYGVIKGADLLHYQIAKMLVKNSSVIREVVDENTETRAIWLLNETEEEYLKLTSGS